MARYRVKAKGVYVKGGTVDVLSFIVEADSPVAALRAAREQLKDVVASGGVTVDQEDES